jgi:uncharacterized NAD-dependent epimerase/dehydratase family protein
MPSFIGLRRGKRLMSVAHEPKTLFERADNPAIYKKRQEILTDGTDMRLWRRPTLHTMGTQAKAKRGKSGLNSSTLSRQPSMTHTESASRSRTNLLRKFKLKKTPKKMELQSRKSGTSIGQ